MPKQGSKAKYDYDMLIIGCGPAGQRAAVQASKIRKRVGEKPAVILTEDWNLYWPMLYFARPYPNLKVISTRTLLQAG